MPTAARMPSSLTVVPKNYPKVAEIQIGETWDILPYSYITVTADGCSYIDKNAETRKPDPLTGVKVRRDEKGYHLILTCRGTTFDIRELNPDLEWIPIASITEEYDAGNPYNWLYEKSKG
jgi:hypothetical protein